MRQLEGLGSPASPKTNIIPFSGVTDIANPIPGDDDTETECANYISCRTFWWHVSTFKAAKRGFPPPDTNSKNLIKNAKKASECILQIQIVLQP